MQTLRKIELSAAALAVSLLVLCSLAIILLRLFTSTAWSVGAVDTLSQYPSHLMVVAALLGGSLALSRGETLKIEVLNNLLNNRSRVLAQRIVSVLGVIFFGAFIALAVRYLTIDYRPVVAFVYLPLLLLILVKVFWLSLTAK
ncbi:MAG: TRAP transporter small permease subunit [Spirochaetes bacterium]|nr:TRAP transporter small permease subunit [Spirochaetota bacterium]MBX3722514.1 TRAP transporter small permease subunit [Turneriella sp.]